MYTVAQLSPEEVIKGLRPMVEKITDSRITTDLINNQIHFEFWCKFLPAPVCRDMAIFCRDNGLYFGVSRSNTGLEIRVNYTDYPNGVN